MQPALLLLLNPLGCIIIEPRSELSDLVRQHEHIDGKLFGLVIHGEPEALFQERLQHQHHLVMCGLILRFDGDITARGIDLFRAAGDLEGLNVPGMTDQILYSHVGDVDSSSGCRADENTERRRPV